MTPYQFSVTEIQNRMTYWKEEVCHCARHFTRKYFLESVEKHVQYRNMVYERNSSLSIQVSLEFEIE